MMPQQVSNRTAATFLTGIAEMVGISPKTLWGVYGTESGYGTNLGPSSGGAQGPFQFLPSTGQQYGLHTTQQLNDFYQSGVAAAQYLKHLGANTNATSPETITAINNYNGNGGGTNPQTSYAQSVIGQGNTYPGTTSQQLGQVFGTNKQGVAYNAAAQNAIVTLAHGTGSSLVGQAANTVAGAVTGAVDTVGSWGAAFVRFVNVLTSASTWIRIGKALAGALLVYMGLKGLTGGNSSPVAVVGRAGRAAVAGATVR